MVAFLATRALTASVAALPRDWTLGVWVRGEISVWGLDGAYGPTSTRAVIWSKSGIALTDVSSDIVIWFSLAAPWECFC